MSFYKKIRNISIQKQVFSTRLKTNCSVNIIQDFPELVILKPSFQTENKEQVKLM